MPMVHKGSGIAPGLHRTQHEQKHYRLHGKEYRNRLKMPRQLLDQNRWGVQSKQGFEVGAAGKRKGGIFLL